MNITREFLKHQKEKVYIGTDFPDEFKFTIEKYKKKNTKANKKKQKANTITAIGEIDKIAYNKAEYQDYFNKHGSKAKYGWYRYDTGLACLYMMKMVSWKDITYLVQEY